MRNAWKKHQDAVYWVDTNLAIRKGSTFCQTQSNAIILQGTLPAYCNPKVVGLKTGEVFNEKAHMSPRLPPKISPRHDWIKELDSKVDRRPEGEVTRQLEGEVARQAKFFNQPNQFQIQFAIDQGNVVKTQLQCKKTLKFFMRPKNSTSTMRQFVKELGSDMDYKIPGLRHSTVKLLQSASVRELIQKIENHPNQLALQRDLRQSESFFPFSPESIQMIQDVGNVELCGLLETEPKMQCKACLSHWNTCIVYCRGGHFLQKETPVNRKFVTNVQWTFQSLSMSSRREHIMDIDMGKSQETKNIIWLMNSRNATRDRSKESMIDSYDISNSVFE